MLTIYEAIESIVIDINNDGVQLNYLDGSAKEVQQRLIDWSKDPVMKSQKYPCLILFTPVETESQQDALNNDTATVNLIIATDTEKTYTTSERKELIFTPTLWVLYEMILAYIRLSPYFNVDSSGRLSHTRIDRFYYASTPAHEQNVFSAVLDAVELSNLSLSIKQPAERPCYLDLVDKYVRRVLNDGGTIEAVECLREKIKNYE